MNWDQIEGKWTQFTSSARERWGKLTEDDWEAVDGKKDQLVGLIQERYGIAKKDAEMQADEWSRAKQETVREFLSTARPEEKEKRLGKSAVILLSHRRREDARF